MKNRMIASRIAVLLMILALLGAVAVRAVPPWAQTPTTATQAVDLAELKIELPKPSFGGTPRPVPQGPHIEPGYFGKLRPPYLAPKDVKLISLKKEVTASDKEPVIGDLTMLTDGEKVATDGNFVEMAPGVQWIQIDLKEPCELYAVVLWHYHHQVMTRVYHDVILRCAEDPDFTTGVRTLFNNDYDNSAGFGVGKDKEYIEDYQGKLFDLAKADGGKPVKARYLRCTSNGSTQNELNHYIEVEVYGKPVK